MFEEKVRFGTLYFCKGAKDEGTNARDFSGLEPYVFTKVQRWMYNIIKRSMV